MSLSSVCIYQVPKPTYLNPSAQAQVPKPRLHISATQAQVPQPCSKTRITWIMIYTKMFKKYLIKSFSAFGPQTWKWLDGKNSDPHRTYSNSLIILKPTTCQVFASQSACQPARVLAGQSDIGSRLSDIESRVWGIWLSPDCIYQAPKPKYLSPGT